MRRIFERYLALGPVDSLRAELNAEGVRTPERRHRNGHVSGGAAFSRGKLCAMLGNPLFVGRIRHRSPRCHGASQQALRFAPAGRGYASFCAATAASQREPLMA